MRPRTVALGETLFFASLVLVLVGSVLTWRVAAATLGAGIALGSIIAVIVVPSLLLLLATRRRSRAALWLLAAWTAFSVWSVVRQTTAGSAFDVVAAITIAQLVLMIASVVLLFAGPSRAWFARRSEYHA